jgi:hypothetical protein
MSSLMSVIHNTGRHHVATRTVGLFLSCIRSVHKRAQPPQLLCPDFGRLGEQDVRADHQRPGISPAARERSSYHGIEKRTPSHARRRFKRKIGGFWRAQFCTEVARPERFELRSGCGHQKALPQTKEQGRGPAPTLRIPSDRILLRCSTEPAT